MGPPDRRPKLAPAQRPGLRKKKHNSPSWQLNTSKFHQQVKLIFLTKLILLTKLSNHFKPQQFFPIHCECISSVSEISGRISNKDDISWYVASKDYISKMISWRRLSYFWFWGQGKGHISFTEWSETIWREGVAVPLLDWCTATQSALWLTARFKEWNVH